MRSILPGVAFEVGDDVEVGIAAEDGELVLPGNGRDPEIVHRDSFSFHLQPQAHPGVNVGGLGIDQQEGCASLRLLESGLHFFPAPPTIRQRPPWHRSTGRR